MFGAPALGTETTRKGEPCSQAFLILPFGCIHNNARDWKSRKKWGRPGGIHDVNDIWWMQGGFRGGGGRGPTTKQCTGSII